MFANGVAIRVSGWIHILPMMMLLVVFTGVIGGIEVHEEVNEGPIVSARLNVSGGSSGGENGGPLLLLTTKLPPLVNERNVNDPGSPASQSSHHHHHHHHQYHQYPEYQQQQQQQHHDEPAHNFTTFPSNHRQQQQHATAVHDHGNGDGPSTSTTDVNMPMVESSSPAAPSASSTTSRASPEGPEGPVTPSTAITTASDARQPASTGPSAIGPHAAFRATSGNSNSQLSKSASIARDRARTRTVQHQISGYRKRQLYASATQPRNANGSTASNEPASDQSSSIEAPFSRDFVPSPEVGVYYGDGESSPMVPIQPPATIPGSSSSSSTTTRGSQAPRTVSVEHGGFVPHAISPAVDALYPTGHGSYGGEPTAGDSRWYTGNAISTPVVRGYQPHQQQQLKTSAIPTTVKWEHRYPMWSHQQSQHQQQQPQTNTVKFPQEAQVTSHTSPFPTPKGKWKWIPEEEEGAGGTPKEVTFSSAAGLSTSSEESSLLRRQPAAGVVTQTRPASVYTFERIPSSVEVPVLGGTPFSSEGVSGSGAAGAGGGNSSTEVIGTSKEVLIGKEEQLHQKSGAVSPWKKIIHVLTAAIPIGLLISALTPQVVYINPNATLPPQSTQLQTPSPVSGAGLSSGGLRQRSLDATGVPDPIGAIQLFQKLMALERDAERAQQTATSNGDDDDSGDDNVSNRLMNAAIVSSTATRLQHCDWMLLCQLVHQRQSPESVAVRRMLWKMAIETPPEWVRQLGLDQILRSIRDGDCGQLQRTCHHQQQQQQDT